MLHCVLRCMAERASRVGEVVQGILKGAESFMLARANACEEDLIFSGDDPVLLFSCFACVCLIRAWVFEWWVSDGCIDVCTCCSVFDGTGRGRERGGFFGCSISELVSGDVGMAGDPLHGNGPRGVHKSSAEIGYLRAVTLQLLAQGFAVSADQDGRF